MQATADPPRYEQVATSEQVTAMPLEKGSEITSSLPSSDDEIAVSSSDGVTCAFLIPFPPAENYSSLTEKDKEALPPFALYAPLAPRLKKPAEGQKESLLHKAQRKWEEEEDEAAKKKTGIKAKGVKLISKGMSYTKSSSVEFLTRTPDKKTLKEIRILYPANLPPEDLKAQFQKFVITTKKKSQKNSVISTALTPVALAFDTVTFIPGPFEITAAWAAASITSASRATAIANGLTADSLTLGFLPDEHLRFLTYRLHELCFHHSKKGSIKSPKFEGEGTPKRGPMLANVVLDALRQQLGDNLSSIDTDSSRMAEDLETMLEKSAKEYTKAVAQ